MTCRKQHVQFFVFLQMLLLPFSASGSQMPGQGLPANVTPEELKGVGITEKLGAQVEISKLQFTNEEGQSVVLSDYFKAGKPVVLNLVYYQCPTLCGFVLQGLLSSLKKMSWTVGDQFELVTLSIDHREGWKLAQSKKKSFVDAYGRVEAKKGWHFLTGEEAQIRALADQVGFGFRYDEKQAQYAHGAGLVVMTPEGKVSRYLYGIDYPEKNFKLALLEASNGRIGNLVDRLILFCYQYNPNARGYSLMVTRLMKAGAAGTTLIFGGFLAVFWRKQRQLIKRDNNSRG